MTRFAILPVLCVASLSAQTSFTVVSPPTANVNFGTNSSSVMFGATVGHMSRTQQADSNWIGSPLLPVITSLSFRRDNAANAGAIARTVDVEILMSHTDYANFSGTFAASHLDPPVTVLPRTMVTLPAWDSTATDPAEFDVVFNFVNPFVPNGTDAILWDVTIFGSDQMGRYPNDWYTSLSPEDYGQDHMDNGAGCTTANGMFSALRRFSALGSALTLDFSAEGAPSNTAVTMLLGIGAFNPVAIPGICAPLGTTGALAVPLGTSDPMGVVSNSINGTFTMDLSSALLSTQAAALDPSQAGLAIALSNATVTSLPATGGRPDVGCKRTFNQNSATSLTGSAPSVTAVPVQYGY